RHNIIISKEKRLVFLCVDILLPMSLAGTYSNPTSHNPVVIIIAHISPEINRAVYLHTGTGKCDFNMVSISRDEKRGILAV
ncbi:hypothetical protein ACJX0J_031979, partial [Zea mays]